MLNKLLQALNDCVFAYNQSKDEYILISPNISFVTGISADLFKADKDAILQIILPADRELFTNAIENLQSGSEIELTYRIRISEKIKWLFEKRQRFIDDAGDDIVLSVIRDVTDKQVVKYHIKESLGDFSMLFDRSVSPMWIYEIPSLRIIKVNQAAIDHYGYSEDEFLEMTIRDIRPKFDLAAFNEYIFKKGITKGTMHGRNSGGIWPHQNKSGETIYAEITGYETKYNDTTCRIIIATDVTDRVLYLKEKEESMKSSNL